MSFPSSLGSHKDDLTVSWSWIRSYAGNLKQRTQQLHDASANGLIGTDHVLDFLSVLNVAKQQLLRAIAVPGIVEYVRSQINDNIVDIVSEWQSLVAQIDATRNWITTNFPQDAQGFLLHISFDGNYNVVVRQLNTTQTAPLRAQLLLLLAAID